MKKDIKTWQERAGYAADAPICLTGHIELGMHTHIADLRAYIAELESRPAAPVVAEGLEAALDALRNIRDYRTDMDATIAARSMRFYAEEALAAHPVAGSPAEASCWDSMNVWQRSAQARMDAIDALHGKGMSAKEIAENITYGEDEITVILNRDRSKDFSAAEPMPASEAVAELVEHLRKRADSAYQFVTIDQAKLRAAADFIERAAPVPASEAANVLDLSAMPRLSATIESPLHNAYVEMVDDLNGEYVRWADIETACANQIM